MAQDPKAPVVTVGGDASGAANAFQQVREEMRKTGEEARRTSTRIGGVFRGLGGMFTGLKSIMGGVFSFMRTVGSTVLSALGAVYNKLKYAVLGVTGALAYSYYAWDKEAKAQVRIGNLLRNNTRNYREAGRELDKLISRVQRTTNFDDDSVRSIFGALIQTTGRRGYQIGQQLTPSILDLSAARGLDPEGLAQAIGRSITTGNAGLLRRQGVMVDDRAFARDPAAAIQAAIGRIAPGTAAEERAAAPLTALIGSLGEVMESLGQIVSRKLNPYIERAANFFYDIANSLGEMSWGDLFGEVKTYAADAFEFIRAYGVAGYESLQANIGTIVQSTLETVGSGFLRIAQDFGPQVASAVKDALVNLITGGAKQPAPNVPWKNLTPGQKVLRFMNPLAGTKAANASGASFVPVSSAGASSPYSGGYNKGMTGLSSAPAGGASPFVYTASAPGPVAGALSSINSRAQQLYQQNTGRTMAQGPLGQAASRFMAGSGGAASMPWADAEYIASGGRLRDALASAQSPQAYAEAARTYGRERSDLATYGRYWEQQDPQALLKQFSKARGFSDSERAAADVRRSVDASQINRRRGALMPAF